MFKAFWELLSQHGSSPAMNALAAWGQVLEVMLIAVGGIVAWREFKLMKTERDRMKEESAENNWEALRWAVSLIRPGDVETIFSGDQVKAEEVLWRWNMVAVATQPPNQWVNSHQLISLVGKSLADAYIQYCHEDGSLNPAQIVLYLRQPPMNTIMALLKAAYDKYEG